MQLNLCWQKGVLFETTVQSGHRFLIEGAPAYEGKNRGPRPMETFLSGAVACSAVDVVHILKKGKHRLTDLKIEVIANRASTTPAVFTDIKIHYQVYGPDNLPESAIARATQLAVSKYCSALNMLANSCQIDYSWEKITTA